MHYEVTINEFSGPLDLLLHLIKKSNIDIYDISLEEITNQYLDYIKKMEELNLDIASEYLVMASELIEYKSRSLLPHTEESSDTYEEDPREELIKKLIDYKKYKEVTEAFKELEEKRSEVYTKSPANKDDYCDALIKNDDYTADDLIEAMKNLLKRKDFEKPIATKITTRELSIPDRISSIRSVLKEKKKVKFDELFDVYDKNFIVVTFLSILEMTKDKEIKIIQDNNFDEIMIEGIE